MNNRISSKEEKWVSDLIVKTWWTLDIHKESSTLSVGREVMESGSGDSSSRYYRCTFRGRPFRFWKLSDMDVEEDSEDITFRTSLLDWDEIFGDISWEIGEKIQAFINTRELQGPRLP